MRYRVLLLDIDGEVQEELGAFPKRKYAEGYAAQVLFSSRRDYVDIIVRDSDNPEEEDAYL